MIVAENCREFVALLMASAALDAWPVLVNARLSAREVDEVCLVKLEFGRGIDRLQRSRGEQPGSAQRR